MANKTIFPKLNNLKKVAEKSNHYKSVNDNYNIFKLSLTKLEKFAVYIEQQKHKKMLKKGQDKNLFFCLLI